MNCNYKESRQGNRKRVITVSKDLSDFTELNSIKTMLEKENPVVI